MQWKPLGDAVASSVWQQTLPQTPYRALVLPFLDYPLAMDLLSGTLRSLTRLSEIGVTLCNINELLETLASGDEAAPVPASTTSTARRYLTVSDVEMNPLLASAPEAQLTDAAIDFLKSNRKEKKKILP